MPWSNFSSSPPPSLPPATLSYLSPHAPVADAMRFVGFVHKIWISFGLWKHPSPTGNHAHTNTPLYLCVSVCVPGLLVVETVATTTTNSTLSWTTTPARQPHRRYLHFALHPPRPQANSLPPQPASSHPPPPTNLVRLAAPFVQI